MRARAFAVPPGRRGADGRTFPYEAARALFLPADRRDEQVQWTYGEAEADQLLCPMGPLPADLAESQRMDADRLGRLLDVTGPAVLVTHSAGGPVGWLAADARPDLVVAIVAVEPAGPAFASIPGMGSLDWGLTAAPITYAPPVAAAAEVRAGMRIPALDGKPVVVVTGGASAFADFAPQVVDFLRGAGADAVRLHLPDHGVKGNGHGLIFEANSDETVRPVIDWIRGLEGMDA
ncbi:MULTISPECIES: hypothetical protein [Amycolatopsis]|uniref:hypothetical protein n=1 Tax=Amycolatopsis TaxID=1813 RepID=UPI001E406793|nr:MULTISPECIES: hypothetical protein [Amycolatopsis]